MQVQELLEKSVQRAPERAALVVDGRKWAYGEIEKRANSVARALIEAGVSRGDRVAVCLENSAEAVFALFGVLKAGAVFLLINPTTKSEKIVFLLNNCRAKIFVTDEKKRTGFSDVWAQVPHLAGVVVLGLAGSREEGGKHFFSFPQDGEDRPPARSGADADLAGLMYTSGTTGHPKGVMLTHRNILSAMSSITSYLKNTEGDVILNYLPLSFGYGLGQVLTMFMVGGSVVLEKSFLYPYVALEKLRDEKATGFPLVPTMAAMLLQLDLSGMDFPALRYFTNAAAPMPLDHIKRLRASFPKASFYSMYGQTECLRVTYLPPEQLDIRPTSVGRGMPNQELWIEDEQGRRVGPGVAGELIVRGPHVMKGYWEAPEETEKKLRPGPLPGEKVLHTGDLFKTDEEGYLYFVSRRDDIIKCRGEKVSPREVEDILCAHAEVVEAAVVGVPDPVLGQAVGAVVVVRDPSRLTPADLLAYGKKHLEDFMVPKRIIFADGGLPKSPNGKIDKRSLVDLFKEAS